VLTLRAGLFVTVASLAVGLGLPPRAVDGPSRITVLLSQDAPPYRQVVQGFQEQLKRSNPSAELVIHVLAPDGDRGLVSQVRSEEPTLVLALGSGAVQVARRIGTVPVVAGMVLRASDVLRGPQFTGVILEFPAEVEFRYLKRILPGQRRVAVMYNSAENQESVDGAALAAQSSGLELLARKVESSTDLPATLQSLTNQADVLWGLADTLVLTHETARTILLFSLQNRIPFVGLSAPWVKAGAVYALERDYVDVGRQCAELAVAILNGAPPASLVPVPPRKVLYLLNRHTAAELKLTLARDVLRGAEAVLD
jgi:putative ABC transport system substrate-binding protein